LAIPSRDGPTSFKVYVDSSYYFNGIPSGVFEFANKGVVIGLKDFIAANQVKQKETSKNDPRFNNPKFIVIHSSASTWGTAKDIRQWHLEKGFKDIGYHYVILNGRLSPNLFVSTMDGSIEVARWWDQEGSHCVGYNTRSISICGISNGIWTEQQESSLIKLCLFLSKQFSIPIEKVLGHCETESGINEGKTCPQLDMDKFRKRLKESS